MKENKASSLQNPEVMSKEDRDGDDKVKKREMA